MAQKEYGALHAEWYELASAQQDHREEIEFWAARIAAAGEPALELGCGTGRALIPLLERGIDMVGIDTSEPMLARCRALCAARGLRAVLQNQPMQAFSLAREFAFVFLASGCLGLFTEDRDIRATFARVHAHLKPGGVFLYEFEQAPAEEPAGDGGAWKGDWVRGPGDVIIAWRKRHKSDPATRTWRQCMIFEKFIGGRLVETEFSDRAGRLFTIDEATHFARSAGFVEVRPTGWLTEEPPAKDAHVVTIRCWKP